MGVRSWLIVIAALALLTSVGCVGVAKASLTLDKTIDLDARPLDGVRVGIRLEWFR